MASVINTNIPSLSAQRNLGKSQMGLETSLQRLSSGLRINSAKDDAAGQSIAERMTSQVRGLDQAVRNSNDAISLTQTAEGGLNDITTALQRLRELAVQSSNATNTDLDRAALQEEAGQLTSEIDRISGQTDFNGIKLLNGGFQEQKFQVGANANEQISVTMDSARIEDLGATQAASLSSRQVQLTSAVDANASLHTINQGDLVINGTTIGTALASDDTASSSLAALSSLSKAAAINKESSETGVTATANKNTALGSGMSAAAATTINLQINSVTILDDVVFSGMDAAERRAAVVSAINEKSGQTGVTAIDSGTADGGVILEAADGRNIHVSGVAGIADISSALGLETGVHLGSYSLTSDKAIEITEGNGRVSDAGLVSGSYDVQKAYVSTEAELSASFNAGDFKINGAVIGNTLASDDTSSTAGNVSSAISKAAAINKISDQTGVTATANENNVSGSAQTAAAVSGTIVINGVATAQLVTSGDADDSRRLTVEAINAISGQTGVRAVDSGNSADGVKLVAEDGRNIVASFGSALTSAATGVTTANSVNYGTFTLSSSAEFSIEAGFNGEEGLVTLGLGSGSYGQGRSGESLDKLDLSTQAGAQKALTSLDNAIQSVNTQRSKLGAVQNRFSSTISNLSTQSENITAARSRIKDADFAKETAELTRNQILQQAGVAMLSQANQGPQSVLSLLG